MVFFQAWIRKYYIAIGNKTAHFYNFQLLNGGLRELVAGFLNAAEVDFLKDEIVNVATAFDVCKQISNFF
ncbi:MAG: hypothetical protein NVSMB7_09890 [Chitinophagaceae bacterium]